MIYHAQPRFTKDIDLFIKADKVNAQATYNALVAFGAQLQGIRSDDFTQPGTWERRVDGVIDPVTGLKASFISAPDLIASKMAAGRPQDIADAEAIRKAAEAQDAHGD